jgi:hypothetical protein
VFGLKMAIYILSPIVNSGYFLVKPLKRNISFVMIAAFVLTGHFNFNLENNSPGAGLRSVYSPIFLSPVGFNNFFYSTV